MAARAAGLAGFPLDIFADLRRRVADILARLVAAGALPPCVDPAASSVDPAPESLPFDAVVDAALVYARSAAARGLDPRAFTRLLAAEIARDPSVSQAEPTDRGFINVALRPFVFSAALTDLLAGGVRFPATRRPWSGDETLAAARAAAVTEALAALDVAVGRKTGASVASRTCCVGPVSVVRCFGRAVPAGGAVGLREAADACGSEALRFALAVAQPAASLALDLDALADRWRGNTAFWIPYVHARCRAALRRAASQYPGGDLSATALAQDAVAHLHRPADLGALRAVLRTPRVVSRCAGSRSAHRLAHHLAGVADAVWARSSPSTYQPQSRFVNEERRDSVGVRLGLVSAAALVLGSGLGVLGLSAPDEVL